MEIRLRIPGTPMQKNAKHKIFASKRRGGPIGRTKTPEYIRFCEKVSLAWDRERAHGKLPPATEGAWEIEVAAYWSRLRHLDLQFAFGDVDAPLECVLDALQAAGVIDDDVRIVRLTAVKYYDKQNPRLEIRLRECVPLDGQLRLGGDV